jgi:alpha-galactosidase
VGTAGVRDLELRVTTDRDNNQYDHSDWGGAAVTCTGSSASTRYVGDASWTSSSNGWGPAERNQSNAEQASGDGAVINVGGVNYVKGVGAHAASDVALTVTGCTRFTAEVGLDAETAGRGSVVFSLVADGTTLYTSGTVTSSGPVAVDVAFSGRTTLHLVVSDGGDGIDYDHADWAGAALAC